MLELTDEAVSTSGIYLKCFKEHVSFLCPNLNPIQIDFLKVIHGGHLVDEEWVASLEPKSPAPLEDTTSNGVATKGGEFEVPHPVKAIGKEMTQKED